MSRGLRLSQQRPGCDAARDCGRAQGQSPYAAASISLRGCGVWGTATPAIRACASTASRISSLWRLAGLGADNPGEAFDLWAIGRSSGTLRRPRGASRSNIAGIGSGFPRAWDGGGPAELSAYWQSCGGNDRQAKPSLEIKSSSGRTPGPRFARRRQQQVGRHAEASTRSLHHRHAQPLLAAQDPLLTWLGAPRIGTMSARARPCWSISDGSGPRRLAAAVAISRAPGRGDQQRLRLQPRDIGRIIRAPKPIDSGAIRARAKALRIAVDHDHRCVHHSVSASIASYWACVPKNRTATTPAGYCTRAVGSASV